MKYCKMLTEISLAVDQFGGKAAHLATLVGHGVVVPSGFVITTEAFQKFHNQPIPEELSTEIFTAFDALHTDQVAVRSSAVQEDSDNASWAGQFLTALNVNRAELLAKIIARWESAAAKDLQAYSVLTNSRQVYSLAV